MAHVQRIARSLSSLGKWLYLEPALIAGTMALTKKDIRNFRRLNLLFAVASILVILFLNRTIGFMLLAISMYFLFAPHKVGD